MLQVELSLTFVSPKEIQKLNRIHRGIDEPTDVLSFPLWTKKELEKIVHNSRGEKSAILLGDIVIAPRVAFQHAKDGWYGEEDFLLFLFEHSIRHLLGYHHK